MKLTYVLIITALASLCLGSVAFSRTWNVSPDGTGDAPTIQAAVDLAVSGDVVSLAPGRYTWANQGTNSDFGLVLFTRGKTGIELRGDSGPGVTILDAQGQGRVLYLMAYNSITIEGLTLVGGVAPVFGDFAGGGIAAHLSSPVFRNCIIKNNSGQQGGGLWFGGVSGPVFENCHFRSNTADYGGAVLLINSSSTMTFTGCTFWNNTATLRGGAIYCHNVIFNFDNCAVYGNTAGVEGGGIFCFNTQPSTVVNCTIAENVSPLPSGIAVNGTSDITVEQSIFSHNQPGDALNIAHSGSLTIGCCDFFGNGGTDGLPPGALDAGGNFALVPQFCGTLGSGDYQLNANSPCAPGNHPDASACGLIGAFPVNCGNVPVEEKSWGEIKALYQH